MGLMTIDAEPLSYRSMNDGQGELCADVLMALDAENGGPVEEQSRFARGMRVVAGGTVAVASRRMVVGGGDLVRNVSVKVDTDLSLIEG